MKNIFNHNQHTSLLKSSLRALRGNLFTSIHSLYLAQGIRLTAYGVFALLFVFVLFIQSGCELTNGTKYIERALGTNSICWEDNDHILIYASIAQYWYNQDVIGGPSKEYDWVGGEIWRITASTGAKELLFRSKDGYAIDNARMYIANAHVYISGGSTAKVREDFSGWDNIGDFIYPIVSSDEIYIVGVETSDLKTIKQYDESGSTVKVLYVNDELITWLDYDYERNYLLINSNKFVDLNTGEEVIVVKYLDRIENYIVMKDPYRGKIEGDYITADLYLEDTISNEAEFYKVVIYLNDLNDKKLLHNISGYRSPSGNYFATPGAILDTLGNIINTFEFSEDEL